jgi:hypothetical protein
MRYWSPHPLHTPFSLLSSITDIVYNELVINKPPTTYLQKVTKMSSTLTSTMSNALRVVNGRLHTLEIKSNESMQKDLDTLKLIIDLQSVVKDMQKIQKARQHALEVLIRLKKNEYDAILT